MDTFYKYLFVWLMVFGCQQKTDAKFFPSSSDILSRFLEYGENLVKTEDLKLITKNFTSLDSKIVHSLDKNNSGSIEKNFEDTIRMINFLKYNKIVEKQSIIQPHSQIINTEYNNFLIYSKNKVTNATLDWIESVLNHSSSTHILTELIAIDRNFEKEINGLITDLNSIKKSQYCVNTGQSQQLLVSFKYYETVMLWLRGLQIIKYSSLVLKESGTKNSTFIEDSVRFAHWFYNEKLSKMLTNMEKIISFLPREYVRCGPVDHNKDSVGEIQAFQRYFISNKQFRESGTCPEKDKILDDITDVNHENLKNMEKCPGGKISNCEDMGDDISVCSTTDFNSNRRYEFVIKTNYSLFGSTEEVFGKQYECDTYLINLSLKSFYNVIPFIRDPICLCTCSDTDSRKSSYVNVMEAMSDYMNYKVMTGVRFVNSNGTFSFQIQEGVLLPDGGIDKDKTQWVDVKVMRKERVGLKRNRIYLDNIDVTDDNAVLTGIKFEVVGKDAIALALHFSKFDVSSGRVKYLGDIGWKSNKDSNYRSHLVVQNEKWNYLPEPKEFGHLRNDETKRRFVEFTTSDLEKDIGQTTIPLIDMQKVEPIPHMPLSGAGLYHKVVPEENGGSGYLGLMLYTKDINK